jgi:hypothetical protein
MVARRRQVFLEDNAKVHGSERKFNVRKSNTIRMNESYRLVTTAPVRAHRVHEFLDPDSTGSSSSPKQS